MKILANVVAVLLVLAGAVWALQGANVIGGSMMSGQSLWLFVGIALVIVGLAVLWWMNFAASKRPAG
jgi:hypothetical protein